MIFQFLSWQWGTVREDYSSDGDCWNYLPHENARSKAYRWGEDGLLGITDRRPFSLYELFTSLSSRSLSVSSTPEYVP